MFKRLKEENGAVAVITAICMVVLMFCVALTVDVGGLLLRRREMVNGADAAAHAAALTYMRTGNTALAQSEANKLFNQNAPRGGSLVSITWSPGYTQAKGTVTVVYTAQQPLYFAPVMGFDSERPVSTTADASWAADGFIEFPEVVIPDGYGSDSHDKVYVCKYVGKPGDERLQTGQNPTLVNYNENWDGQTLFMDAQGYSVVIALKDTPGPGVEPKPTCPEPGPHVWLSN